MTHAEFADWSLRSRQGFADQQVASGLGPRREAEAYAAEEHAALLPDGLATPEQHLWTVREGDRPVGQVWLRVRAQTDGREGYLFDIVLDPDARGRGLGRATMCLVEERARALGATRIRLNVFAHNVAAVRLYDRLGYAVIATVMSKRLDGAAPTPYAGGAEVTLAPMRAAQLVAFRPEQEARYAQHIADAGVMALPEAREKAAADFQRLLPAGLASPEHELWSAYDGHAEVGFVWLHLTERSDGVHAFGYALEVRKPLRRRGYGRAVLRAAEAGCRERGVRSVGLSLFGSNAAARSLYDQEGFEVNAEMRRKDL